MGEPMPSTRAQLEPVSDGDGRIHVCSLEHMPSLCAHVRPRRLVTIINPTMVPDTPPGIDARHHLKIVCSDICEPADGRVCPEPNHVADLISFFRAWDRQGPLLIHCLAGVSRSTAAAYIALCALNEGCCELKIAERLRAAAPDADPNRLLVALADEALRRQGRMLNAVAAIGRSKGNGPEGRPFWLPSRFA
jgi:predicted protein tyrosine phosphatase